MDKLFIIIILIKITIQFEINYPLLYCKTENKIIDFENSCETNDLHCNILKNSFESFSKLDNEFFLIKNQELKQQVFYAANSNIYETTCQDVLKINISEKPSQCTKDILISFYLNNTKIVAFLNKEKIIIDKTSPINCKISEIFLKFIDGNKTIEIIRENKKVFQKIYNSSNINNLTSIRSLLLDRMNNLKQSETEQQPNNNGFIFLNLFDKFLKKKTQINLKHIHEIIDFISLFLFLFALIVFAIFICIFSKNKTRDFCFLLNVLKSTNGNQEIINRLYSRSASTDTDDNATTSQSNHNSSNSSDISSGNLNNNSVILDNSENDENHDLGKAEEGRSSMRQVVNTDTQTCSNYAEKETSIPNLYFKCCGQIFTTKQGLASHQRGKKHRAENFN